MTKQIFQVRTYIDEEDSKPSGVFDLNLPQLYGPGREQYLINFAVCQGLAEVEKWVPPDLHAYTPGSTPVHAWDFYEYSGSLGVLSPSAVKVLTPFFEDRFTVLPCTLDGAPYYCLRCLKRIDCLDPNASEFHYSVSEPHELAWVDKCVFPRDVEVPVLFAVPEDPRKVFCTDSVPSVVSTSGLRGFRFEPCDLSA